MNILLKAVNNEIVLHVDFNFLGNFMLCRNWAVSKDCVVCKKSWFRARLCIAAEKCNAC